MIKLLKTIDQFGVAFQPSIKYTTSQYKTCWGGVMSILLYGLSFAYLLYIIIQWRTGQILPKITTSSKVENNQYFQLNEKFVDVQLRKFGYSMIDPFNPDALVLQPLLYVFKNGIPLDKPLVPFYQITTKEDTFHIISFSNLSLSISETRDETNPEYEVMLTFGACLQSFLQEGQACANETVIKQFTNQPTNALVVKYYAKEYNTQTENLEIIGREQIIPFQISKVYQTQTYIQITQTQVDVGFLFESTNDYMYINEYRVVSATLDLEYYNGLFGYNVYMAFLYKIDNIQIEISVVYTKISEILAEAGSIASTLLLLSYLVIILNQSQLEFEAINHVIQMYYPEFKNVKITKNIFGYIKKVEKNGRQLDLQTFKHQYQKLSQISEIKLTISNQIYEISRLQFLIQNILPSKIIQQIHHYGIPLQLQYADSAKEEQQNINKLDCSINQDYQYKLNSILPNNTNPPIVKSNDDQTISQTESKLIQNQLKIQDNNHIIPIQQFKEQDFELLIYPESEIEGNTQANQNDTKIQPDS
ncbi:unnamed protein product [Paramecium pentaurelia]|uniref:Transmembrane protein n=1 Tax=Paramecium pentaurelia TaxID=43138 RepID=A0A8S1YE87_9CILI|nr:unnamed protein product [Paramecium pentaurelia]